MQRFWYFYQDFDDRDKDRMCHSKSFDGEVVGHHLPFRDKTITPLDFATITGLRVDGDLIPFDSSLYRDTTALEFYLGRVPTEVDHMVRYTQFE